MTINFLNRYCTKSIFVLSLVPLVKTPEAYARAKSGGRIGGTKGFKTQRNMKKKSSTTSPDISKSKYMIQNTPIHTSVVPSTSPVVWGSSVSTFPNFFDFGVFMYIILLITSFLYINKKIDKKNE